MEGADQRADGPQEGYTNISVLQLGTTVEYAIPSFHVVTVALREAKLQYEDETFDGFIRCCDLLNSVNLPAIARVPRGSKGACFVKVICCLICD